MGSHLPRPSPSGSAVAAAAAAAGGGEGGFRFRFRALCSVYKTWHSGLWRLWLHLSPVPVARTQTQLALALPVWLAHHSPLESRLEPGARKARGAPASFS
jgi:hypothetical protein